MIARSYVTRNISHTLDRKIKRIQLELQKKVNASRSRRKYRVTYIEACKEAAKNV